MKNKKKLKLLKDTIKEIKHELELCDVILSEVRDIKGFQRIAISKVRATLQSLMDDMSEPEKFLYG